MYGITALIEYPGLEDPKLKNMEVFDTVEEAVTRANALVDDYHEEYDEDWSQRATVENLFACAGNSDVCFRVYIAEVK